MAFVQLRVFERLKRCVTAKMCFSDGAFHLHLVPLKKKMFGCYKSFLIGLVMACLLQDMALYLWRESYVVVVSARGHCVQTIWSLKELSRGELTFIGIN